MGETEKIKDLQDLNIEASMILKTTDFNDNLQVMLKSQEIRNSFAKKHSYDADQLDKEDSK